MESFGRIFDIAGMIVVLAIITTLVAHTETKKVISAIGDAFAGSLRVAMGN
jgi:uncharacterized membrane protein